MNNNAFLSFCGSNLDRAGALRSDENEIEALKRSTGAKCVVFWRGKPLISKDSSTTLVRLTLGHPLVSSRLPSLIFLGLESTGPCFACDVSDWSPEEGDVNSLSAFVDESEQHHPSLPQNQVFCELRRVMTWLNARDGELAAMGRALFLWHHNHRFCSKCGAKTEMAQAGWQRDCKACGALHFPRTDPVVIMLITYQDQLLLGRSHGWPEGMYSLLAGFVEPGETLEAAVRREVLEESGITVGKVGYLTSQPWPFPASMMLGCWGQALNQEIQVDPVEIEDALWVGRQELMDVYSETHPKIKSPRGGSISQNLMLNWLADRIF